VAWTGEDGTAMEGNAVARTGRTVWVVTWSEYRWERGDPFAVCSSEEKAMEAATRKREIEEAEHPWCGCDWWELEVDAWPVTSIP
jgi:hypothetical protein